MREDVLMAVVVLMAEFLTVREVSMSGGGGGGGGRSALAVKVEAVLSVVELLVVSDRSRYLKFSLAASFLGLGGAAGEARRLAHDAAVGEHAEARRGGVLD